MRGKAMMSTVFIVFPFLSHSDSFRTAPEQLALTFWNKNCQLHLEGHQPVHRCCWDHCSPWHEGAGQTDGLQQLLWPTQVCCLGELHLSFFQASNQVTEQNVLCLQAGFQMLDWDLCYTVMPTVVVKMCLFNPFMLERRAARCRLTENI